MKNKELSIKSKLLFNHLDMNFKNIIDLNMDSNKRIRSINNIFSTYRLTLNPFIKDENREYVESVMNTINKRQEEINRMVYDKATDDSFIFEVSPILEHLKKTIRTCKINLDEVNKLWKI